MPLMQVVIALIVVGVLLWLVNRFIPMAGSIKSILNAVVVICVVVWLLNIFGLMHYITNFHINRAGWGRSSFGARARFAAGASAIRWINLDLLRPSRVSVSLKAGYALFKEACSGWVEDHASSLAQRWRFTPSLRSLRSWLSRSRTGYRITSLPADEYRCPPDLR